MKICAAQFQSKPGAIDANIKRHVELIEAVLPHNPDLIIFPELSITGYEPTLAKELATTADDIRFDVFQELADQNQLIIGVGFALKHSEGVRIALFFFMPNAPSTTYSKQLLHDDELPYFVPGTQDLFLDVKGIRIAPAICYESLQPTHIEKAKKNGANLYIASVAKPAGGLQKANEYFPKVAKQHQMTILMANAVGPSDNFVSAGQSAVWNQNGELAQQLNAKTEGWLLWNSETNETKGIGEEKL